MDREQIKWENLMGAAREAVLSAELTQLVQERNYPALRDRLDSILRGNVSCPECGAAKAPCPGTVRRSEGCQWFG